MGSLSRLYQLDRLKIEHPEPIHNSSCLVSEAVGAEHNNNWNAGRMLVPLLPDCRIGAHRHDTSPDQGHVFEESSE